MNDKMPLPELLQWLAAAPRTYGWSAILAYDRDKTNIVLRQEYIERFDNASYLPPYSELIHSTDDTAQYTYNYIFDAARLSFVNSTISSSQALLTQKVIGGSQLTLSKPSGWVSTQVDKVYSLDAMDGPLLESEISLAASSGEVNQAGQVVLDISSGRNPRLTFARTEHEREEGGKHFMARFADLQAPQKILVLNQLALENDQFLKPAAFQIRTHAAPDSHMPGTQEHGAGAVLVFIRMQGEGNGSIPIDDSDLLYLIPDGHSATVLLGQEFYLRKVVMAALEANLAAGAVYEWVRDASGLISRARVTDARSQEIREHVLTDPVFESMRIDPVVLGLASSENVFNVHFANGRVSVELEGRNLVPMVLKLRSNGMQYEGTAEVFWTFRQTYLIEFDPQNGNIRLTLQLLDSLEGYRTEPHQLASHPPVMEHFYRVNIFGINTLTRYFRQFMSELPGHFATIDAFRLNSLLFRGDNTVRLGAVHAPGDLALFGDVGPTLTDFVITPLEPVVGHGQSQSFTTLPQRNGITWSLEPLPGESGAIGSIDASGKYTAPQADEIDGVHVRVRVRATLGQHTSTALVSVVVRDISVNPLVQVCGVGQSRAMSAGTLGNGTLTWTIANPGNGATIAPSSEADVDHLYTAGPHIRDAEFVVDEVVVTNGQTGNQQSAYVVVPHGLVGLQVFYEATANPGQVLCKALFSNGAPTDGFVLEWGLLAGSGSIDDTGLFTVDTAGQQRFAVVSCVWRGPMSMIGYCVLPLPLIPLPDLLKVLGDAGALLSRSVEEEL